jgi:hypothetical protein
VNRIALLLALLGAATTALGEPAVVVGNSPLLEAPTAGAKPLMTVPEGTHVEIMERRGVWFRVGVSPSGEPEGWLRFSQVRAGGAAVPAATKPQGGVLSNLARQATGLFAYSGRTAPQSGGVVSTIGVRGLRADDLMAAHPDPAELGRMDGYQSTTTEAARFAAALPLEPQKVAYLDGGSAGGGSTTSASSSGSTGSTSSTKQKD